MSQEAESSRAKIDWFKRFVDVATLIIITIGLYFAWDQAGRLRESIETSNSAATLSAWSNITSQTLDLDSVFIAHPELQKFFYEGVDIDRKSPDFLIVYSIAVKQLDYLDGVASFVSYQSEAIQNPVLEPQTWRRYIHAAFRASPILCRLYLDNRDQYGSPLRRIALPACSKPADPSSRP